MKNPYIELQREFKDAGAEVLLSSGQACVMFGIATFSKDGDWIIRENKKSCEAVLEVLTRHNAHYRLGAPLDPKWLGLCLTSHFEYMNESGFRMRTDFCSRPPRVHDIECMWKRATEIEDIDIVDVKSLIQIKQTRRTRDYSVIGALAEMAGLEGDAGELSLAYLQDYETLARAVSKWSDKAAASKREAVQLLVAGASRPAVVATLAIEQDAMMQEDQRRIDRMQSLARNYVREFVRLRYTWRGKNLPLHEEHRQLINLAAEFLEKKK